MKLIKTPSLYIRAFVSIVTLVLLNAGWVALSFVYGERMRTFPFTLVIHFLWFVVMLIPMIVLGTMIFQLLHTMKVQNLNVANDTNNVHFSNKPSVIKLSSNEEYLRSVLDSAAMYVVRVDLHGNYTYLNRSFLETFVSYDDRENIIGLSSLAHIIPEDQAGMTQAIDQCVANPTKIVQIELRKPALDGTIYTTEWKFALVQNTDGANVEIQCSGLNVTERKSLENQLRVEQENTAELMNTINSIVWEADAETFQFLYVSAAAERMLGYSTEQWTSEPEFWQRHIHPDDREEKVSYCQKATREMRDHDFEYRFIKANGDYVWLRDIVTVVSKNGKAFRLKGIMVDISEQKNIAKELRNAEEHFRSAVNALGEGIALQDSNAKIVFCNARAEEILGLSTDQMSGRTSLDPRWRAVHEDGSSFPGENHPAMVTLRTGVPQHNIVMGIHKPDGKLTWLLVNSQPIRYTSTVEISGVVVSFTEITQQKEQEAALRSSEERYRFIAENSLDMIALHTPEGEYTYISPSVEMILGYTAEEMIGKNPYDFIHRDDAERIRDAVIQAALRRETVITITYRIRHRDGSYRWFETKTKVILNRLKREVTALQSFSRDVTERVQMEKELEESNSRLKALLSAIPIPIAVTRLSDGKVMFNNESLQQFLGLPPVPSEHPTSINFYANPGDRKRFLEGLKSNGSVKNMELQLKKSSGEDWWSLVSALPLDFEGEKAIFSAFNDITERKRIEEEVIDKNRFIKTVTDALPSMVGYWTIDLHCSFANAAYLEWFGRSHDEMIGISIQELLGTTLFEKNEPYIKAVLSGEPQKFERTLVKPNNDSRFTLSQYIPDFSESGRVLGFIALVTDITDIKKAQDSLNEAQRQAHIGSWEWDIVANTIVWSDEQYRLFGEDIQSSDISYEKYLSHLSVVEQERTNELVRMALEGKGVYAIEHEITRPDNTTIFVFEQGQVVFDGDNQPIRMLGTTQDITDRKRVEDELRQNEANLRAIFDASVQIHYLVDCNYQILAFNKIAADTVSQSLQRELCSGDSIWEYVAPESKKPFQEHFQKAITGEASRYENFIELSNLGRMWFEFRYVPVRDEGGSVIGVSFSALDITERKRLETDLRNARDFYESLVSTVNVILWEADPATHQVLFISNQAKEMLGYAPEEWSEYAMFWRDHLHPEDRDRVFQFAEESANAGIDYEIEYRFIKADGDVMWLRDVVTVESQNDKTKRLKGVLVDITALKKSEERLLASNNRLQTILGAVPFPIAISRVSDGAALFINAPLRNMIDIAQGDDFALQTMLSLQKPDEQAWLVDVVFKKGNADNVELAYRSKTGEQRWVVVTSLLIDYEGEKAVLAAFNDITERKELLLRMAEYSQELQSIIDSMMDGLVLLDADQRIVLVNPALKEMFGYTEEEMLGESLSKLIPKRYQDRHIGSIERFLHGDASQQRVRAGIGLRANGSEFPMESSLAYFHYGSTVMMLAIVRDITESKAQEDKIRQSEANLRSIMDSSVQAFWLTDTELRVQAFNKLTAQIVRSLFGREIILGDSILNYVQPEQQKNFLESARKALAGEVVVYEEKFAMEHGEEQWMELMYLPTYNAEGKTIGLTLSSFNTTERKIAYQTLAQMNEALEDRVEVRTRELVQLNNEKNEFLGIAAHDLKNPLAGILSSAEILSRYFAEDIAIQRFTKMIISASDQMLDIIKNLLDVNRIESGLVQLTIQPVNLEILDSVVEEYQTRSAQKGIIIHYESPQSGTVWVLGDTQSVRQILDNLISNAVKYSPQWKPIWVRVLHRKDDDGVNVVRVEVQDEGPGLTEEDKKKLFGKFARLSAQPTGGENSTGLGLSIVKKLVELQHGRVWCESTPGLGTTFIIELLAADV